MTSVYYIFDQNSLVPNTTILCFGKGVLFQCVARMVAKHVSVAVGMGLSSHTSSSLAKLIPGIEQSCSFSEQKLRELINRQKICLNDNLTCSCSNVALFLSDLELCQSSEALKEIIAAPQQLCVTLVICAQKVVKATPEMKLARYVFIYEEPRDKEFCMTLLELKRVWYDHFKNVVTFDKLKRILYHAGFFDFVVIDKQSGSVHVARLSQ